MTFSLTAETRGISPFSIKDGDIKVDVKKLTSWGVALSVALVAIDVGADLVNASQSTQPYVEPTPVPLAEVKVDPIQVKVIETSVARASIPTVTPIQTELPAVKPTDSVPEVNPKNVIKTKLLKSSDMTPSALRQLNQYGDGNGNILLTNKSSDNYTIIQGYIRSIVLGEDNSYFAQTVTIIDNKYYMFWSRFNEMYLPNQGKLYSTRDGSLNIFFDKQRNIDQSEYPLGVFVKNTRDISNVSQLIKSKGVLLGSQINYNIIDNQTDLSSYLDGDINAKFLP